MKLQFKHQKFQADAAHAVCEIFAGQPLASHSYKIDPGNDKGAVQQQDYIGYTGFSNERLTTSLTDELLLARIQTIQRQQLIKPSTRLEGQGLNLTIEMETGVGKTYTYIKTMFELNKLYGWCKFIVVVPSIAIREGVYKSFEITQDHFNDEYGKKIRFFIYNSGNLPEISHFAQDSAINVMIINSQAFNARGKDARRIYMELDEFRSRRPIDVISRTNPILIIDEPQSVEGKQTKERLKEFRPLFTLRYSATHKTDSIYNMIYRLDAVDAYNQHLVKKIAVKGIFASGTTGTEGYLYLQNLILSPDKPPMASMEFEVRGKDRIRKEVRRLNEGDNLYELSRYAKNSEGIEAYKDRYVIKRIDGRDNSVEFLNGIKLYAGDVTGAVNEDHLRRIQIRETIISHLERERQLFHMGIKVLSLFFIDEVAKYKVYNTANQACNGIYADVFEEEYQTIVQEWIDDLIQDERFRNYLKSFKAAAVHTGYFSVDKKSNRLVDCKIGDKKEQTTDDVDAYDLIMRNKERLLDRAEPVRFIFSHSALREGWDNPNVFQICTLKQSSAEVRKRQEVGRGLRLCVNQNGERMDSNILESDVHNINVLTVIANESYDRFAKALQSEYAEAVADRPREVRESLFVGKVIRNANGEEKIIVPEEANDIVFTMIQNAYIDKRRALTEKYYIDKVSGTLEMPESLNDYKYDIVKIIDSIYDPSQMSPENALNKNVTLQVNKDKLAKKEFLELWKRINIKTAYIVDFETDELIRKSIDAIDSHLLVSKMFFVIETGHMNAIESKDSLKSGDAFSKTNSDHSDFKRVANQRVKYDLIGKIVTETGLTRDTVLKVLKGIRPDKFEMFKLNPEEFIINVSTLINEQKATVIVQEITYNKLTESYDTSIFTEPTIKGTLGINAMEASRHLYDYVVFDSKGSERKFAEALETSSEVILYIKLPRGFYINTPVGKYNPDWAIAFDENKVKHVYFVAETKGDMSSLQLRGIENAKIQCAKKHFAAISTESIIYDHVDSYETLLKIVK